MDKDCRWNCRHDNETVILSGSSFSEVTDLGSVWKCYETEYNTEESHFISVMCSLYLLSDLFLVIKQHDVVQWGTDQSVSGIVIYTWLLALDCPVKTTVCTMQVKCVSSGALNSKVNLWVPDSTLTYCLGQPWPVLTFHKSENTTAILLARYLMTFLKWPKVTRL